MLNSPSVVSHAMTWVSPTVQTGLMSVHEEGFLKLFLESAPRAKGLNIKKKMVMPYNIVDHDSEIHTMFRAGRRARNALGYLQPESPFLSSVLLPSLPYRRAGLRAPRQSTLTGMLFLPVLKISQCS